jgi:tRNA dimethylallyltransferase
VGKTTLSLQLAQRFQTEIISADSRQMYRHLNIGTAKPSLEERAGIPHHFIDSLDPDQPYNAGQFEREAENLIAKLFENHEAVIVAGGSTLYMDALWFGFHDMPAIPPEIRQRLNDSLYTEGLPALLDRLETCDPTTFHSIDQNNPIRVIRALEVFEASGKPISHFRKGRLPKTRPYELIQIGLTEERSTLYERIDQRVLDMIKAGLEAECRQLLEMGYSPEMQALHSIGYQEMFTYFAGHTDRKEAIRRIQRNSRRYAKRQLTYYRRYPEIEWFQAGEFEKIEKWLGLD